MNKQKKKILNQKQKKLVHFLVNGTKIIHKTIKSSLKKWWQVDLDFLNEKRINIFNKEAHRCAD